MAYRDMDIEVDFGRDRVATLRSALTTLGYKPPADDDCVQRAYVNALKRRVPAWPRAVRVATTLVCPPAHRAGLAEITRKVEAGESIEPHLSRLLVKRDYNDGMLNDWGFHHLHLGSTQDADGFVTRTGPVLFVRFLEHEALFVGVYEHRENPWWDPRVLEAFWANWPEQMARYELRGIAPSRFGCKSTIPARFTRRLVA